MNADQRPEWITERHVVGCKPDQMSREPNGEHGGHET